jgi:hypothetical protein
VNTKPGFLQQVIGICTALGLCKKKPVQLRADTADQRRGRTEIALLVANHQHLEIAVRGHEWESLHAICISPNVFSQTVPHRPLYLRTQFKIL